MPSAESLLRSGAEEVVFEFEEVVTAQTHDAAKAAKAWWFIGSSSIGEMGRE